ncbi:MAG: serine hydrolase domain-containing protein [Mycobacteriales bacterium]
MALTLNRRTLLAAAAALAAVPATAALADPAPAGVLPPLDTAALDRTIAGLPDAKATAALATVRGAAGRWTGAGGVSDLRTHATVWREGRFRIGSVTKVFTATVVLQLVAERRLRIDDPVRRYLPGLLPPAFDAVAVGQLLDHTSGLGAGDGAGTPEDAIAHRYDTVTPEALVADAAAAGPSYPPGTAQDYNNTGYTVAGLLIEKVTGRSYAHEVTTRILRPLGLRGTSVPGADPRIHGPHAHGYQALGSGRLVDVTEWNQSESWAAGDLISTAADLDRFLTALFRGALLPPRELALMFTVPPVRDLSGRPAAYGMGLSRLALPNGLVIWGKDGARWGYTAAVAATRDLRRRVVFSVNSTDAKGQDQFEVGDRILLVAFEGGDGS